MILLWTFCGYIVGMAFCAIVRAAIEWLQDRADGKANAAVAKLLTETMYDRFVGDCHEHKYRPPIVRPNYTPFGRN